MSFWLFMFVGLVVALAPLLEALPDLFIEAVESWRGR